MINIKINKSGPFTCHILLGEAGQPEALPVDGGRDGSLEPEPHSVLDVAKLPVQHCVDHCHAQHQHAVQVALPARVVTADERDQQVDYLGTI